MSFSIYIEDCVCCGLLDVERLLVSRYVGRVFSFVETVDCGHHSLWIVAIVHCVLWLLEYPGFGLQLSCFGHIRAKTHSELPCRLELCLTFCLGLSPVILLLHKAVKGLFCF